MADVKIIGIELDQLIDIVRGVVRDEITLKAGDIISTLRDSSTDLIEGKQYTTNMVAAILGVTRNTILNYRKSGILSEPSINLSGNPVWTAKQIKSAGYKKGIETKFKF
jgi:hypothetical protein